MHPEANLHIIESADWIIDLGSKGGAAGGQSEQMAKVAAYMVADASVSPMIVAEPRHWNMQWTQESLEDVVPTFTSLHDQLG